MKNKSLLISFLSLSSFIFAQNNTQTSSTQGFVGINTDTPKAALDIKSTTNNGNNVLRFSTIPSEANTSNDYVLFAGEKIDNGYNLRKITPAKFYDIIAEKVPSVKKIALLNSVQQTIAATDTSDVIIKMDKLVTNTSTSDFVNNADGTITLKTEGFYSIDFWAGFEALERNEGDILITIQKKSNGETNFTNYRAAIVSRSPDNSRYALGNGIGTNVTFVDEFKAGDTFRIIVNNYFKLEMKTLVGSFSFTASKIK